VFDALAAAGAEPRLAEPVETRALRGRKRRAETDRKDARWLRELLGDGRLPETWIPPEHARQWRSRARLRHTLIGERKQWMQRIQATLFHHGVSGTPERLRTGDGRAFLERLPLPPDPGERITITLTMVDAIDAQIAPLERELRQLARRQSGCRALLRLYGTGELTSLITLCELGDVGRLSASRKAVRMAGIDIGVHRPTVAPGSASSTARAARICAGRSMRPRWPPVALLGGSGETTSETRRQVALTPTDAPIKPRATIPAVRNRILRGVSHEKPFVASHARTPVTPAAAVVAPIMH
jgi:transposase